MESARDIAYQVYHSIQVFEATLLQDSRVHIVLEVSIIKRHSNTVQAKTGKELGIFFQEEVLQKFVEKELVILLA